MTNEERLNALFEEGLQKGIYTPEEVAALRTTLLKDKTATDFIGGAVAGQSELSRRAQEIQTAQTAFDQQKQQWTTWYNENKSRYGEVEARARAAEGQAAALAAIARSYEIPEDEVSRITAASRTPASQPAPPAYQAPSTPNPNAPKYIDESRFYQSEREMAIYSARKDDLNAQHFRLYGEPIPNMTAIVTYAEEHGKDFLAQNKDPLTEAWRHLHNVSAKEAENATKERTAWEEQIRQDERAKLAASQLPTAPSPDFSAARVGSNIFTNTSDTEAGGHRDRTARASAALMQRVQDRRTGQATRT